MGSSCSKCGEYLSSDRINVDINCYGVSHGRIIKAELCLHLECILKHKEEEEVLVECF